MIICFKASTPQPAGLLAPPNEGSNQVPFRGQSLPRAFPVSPKATSPAPDINFDRFGQYGKTPERPKFRKQRSITDLLCTTEDGQPPPLPPPKEPKWGQNSQKQDDRPLYNPFAKDNERKSMERPTNLSSSFTNGNGRDAVDFVKQSSVQQNVPIKIQSPTSNGRNQLPPKHPTMIKPMGVNYVQVAMQEAPRSPSGAPTLQLPSPSISYTSTPTPPPLPTPEPPKENMMQMKKMQPLPPPPPSQVMDALPNLPLPPKQVPNLIQDHSSQYNAPVMSPPNELYSPNMPPPRPPKSSAPSISIPSMSTNGSSIPLLSTTTPHEAPPKANTFKPPPPPPPPPPMIDDDMHFSIKAPAKKTGVVSKAQANLEKEKQEKIEEERRRAEEAERKRIEELRRLEELKRIEEQKRLEEQRRIEEQRRLEEQRRIEELRRQEEEKRRLEEEQRRQEEQRRLEEQIRLEEEMRLQEQLKMEEQKRLEEEKRLAEEKRIREEMQILENERMLREQQKFLDEQRMEQERKKLAMQSANNQNATEADDDASQWILLQQKQEELKKLLEREQELKLLREQELSKLQMEPPLASFDPEDPEKAFREWLRQQEVENESINKQDNNILFSTPQNSKDCAPSTVEKLPPTPPSILKSSQRKQDGTGVVQVEGYEVKPILVQRGTVSPKTPGSPKQKRVTIMAVKEPVKDDKELELQAALNMQKEIELKRQAEELERQRLEQEELQRRLELKRQKQEMEYRKLQERERQRELEYIKQMEEEERQEKEKQFQFEKEQDLKRKREFQEQQEREAKIKEEQLAEQRRQELQVQQERDAKIREQQLREQRLRENQTKLQNQQIERNVPIHYPHQNNVTASSLPPPRQIPQEELRGNVNQYTGSQPLFQEMQKHFPPPRMATNPVSPPPNMMSSNLPHQGNIPTLFNEPALTIDPFSRSSGASSNNIIPDDAFRNRGRPTKEPQVLSPTGSRERTIPIKIESQKYSDVS